MFELEVWGNRVVYGLLLCQKISTFAGEKQNANLFINYLLTRDACMLHVIFMIRFSKHIYSTMKRKHRYVSFWIISLFFKLFLTLNKMPYLRFDLFVVVVSASVYTAQN